MNKQEAIQSMKNGNKITNQYFTKDEYLYIDEFNTIRSEDNVNFTMTFIAPTYLTNVDWQVKSE